MKIRIVKTPRGEAPESIRAAWVGLSLPAKSDVVERYCLGVLSGARRDASSWLRRLFRGVRTERGYLVEAAAAVTIPEQHNSTAARWWRTTTPYLLTPGMNLLFFEECAIVDGEPEAG